MNPTFTNKGSRLRAFACFYEKCKLTSGIGDHDLLSVVDIDAVGWIIDNLTVEIVIFIIGGGIVTLRNILDVCRVTVRNEPYTICFHTGNPVSL